jgi:hypothetical protein
MLQTWRADGYGFDVLELWSVGYPTTEDVVDGYASGADAACFMDTVDLFTVYGAAVDDLFVIDTAGMVQLEMSTLTQPLTVAENRAYLDTRVRALLP